jgi:hypothetical protein
MQLTLALSNSLESSYVGKIAFIERRLTELNFGRDLRAAILRIILLTLSMAWYKLATALHVQNT